MNKKVILLVAVVSITILSFSVVSPVFASELNRGGPGNGGMDVDGDYLDGAGNRGALGTGTGIPADQSINLDGILENLMHASMAEVLEMDFDDMTDLMDAGETFSDIALDMGVELEEINDMIAAARADAMAQAVEDGEITQEQADWMASRGNRMSGENYGEEICDGTGECLEDGLQQSTMMEYGYRKGAGK